LGEIKMELLLDTKSEEVSEDIFDETILDWWEKNINSTEIENTKKMEFNIPNNIWDIEIMKTILDNHPGNINIKIWKTEKTISQEWLDKIRSLL
jgi:hypothetical protein